jgi:hypothetical protein
VVCRNARLVGFDTFQVGWVLAGARIWVVRPKYRTGVYETTVNALVIGGGAVHRVSFVEADGTM